MALERRGWRVWAAVLPIVAVASPVWAARPAAAEGPGLTYAMVDAIAREIRTGPLGQGGVYFGDVSSARDAQSLLRTLGLGIEDLWWVPDADGNGVVEAADAALMMRSIGGFAEGATADKVARAFATAGLAGDELSPIDAPAEPVLVAAHNDFFSKTWTDHFKETSVQKWPPNHSQSTSQSWPGGHDKNISQTWPPEHYYLYSMNWPPAHQKTISPNVPPDHIVEVSRDWPIETHQQALSRLWPPGHTKAISVQWPKDHTTKKSQQTLPSPHHEVYSRTWPFGHTKARSNEVWPPNHDGPISLTWNDHDLTVSKSNWPPSHRADISKTWKDGDSWPPNHLAEISRTWTVTAENQPAEPAIKIQ